jgi:hypothetical protein
MFCRPVSSLPAFRRRSGQVVIARAAHERKEPRRRSRANARQVLRRGDELR